MSQRLVVPLAAFAFGIAGLLAAQQPPVQPDAAKRPFLGVAFAPNKGDTPGAFIVGIDADSPAAKAGLKAGDVVTKVGGKEVATAEDFYKSIRSHKPGDKLDLEVVRDGKSRPVAVTLGTRPAQEGPSPPAKKAPPFANRPAFLGIGMEPLTPELRTKLGIKSERGVVVAEVLPNSPAARAGLQKDDVITQAGGQGVSDPVELGKVVRKTGAGKELTLHVERGKEEKDVKVTLKEGPIGPIPGRPGAPGCFEGAFPVPNIEGLFDQSSKIRDLERRIELLEKKLKALEGKPSPPEKK